MKPIGLPGAKKRSAADERAKAIKLATREAADGLEPHLEPYLEPYPRLYLELI
jgi:hypothetical protein